MAKWIVNTVEDFVEVECDYVSVSEDGTLYAYKSPAPSGGTGTMGCWAKGFWLSVHQQEPEDTT
jgi:hypothetical protein